jgi:head-tail adaptor
MAKHKVEFKIKGRPNIGDMDQRVCIYKRYDAGNSNNENIAEQFGWKLVCQVNAKFKPLKEYEFVNVDDGSLAENLNQKPQCQFTIPHRQAVDTTCWIVANGEKYQIMMVRKTSNEKDFMECLCLYKGIQSSASTVR